MRERVLDAAEAMVQERGLAAVSFQQLADAVGLSKASVFHHFPNKDEMAKALVDRCRTKYRAGYDAVIESDAPAPEKLERIAKLFDDGLQENRLCLLNSLGQSISILSDDVQSELRVSASRAIDRFSLVFEQGSREGTLSFKGSPTDAAAGFLALLEGLQVLSRSKRDHGIFMQVTRSYIQTVSV